MRTIRRFTASALVVAAVACSGKSDRAADAALDRDLALATLELAPNPNALTVAPSEVSPPVRTAPRAPVSNKPSPTPEPMPEPVSVEPAELVAIEDVPEMVEAPVGVPAEIERPAPTRRPAPIPASVPVGGVGGPGDDGGIGDVIGVVIRGGGVGVDDCKRHPHPTGRPGVGTVLGGIGAPVPIARRPVIRGGVAINNRLPTRGRGGSFPR